MSIEISDQTARILQQLCGLIPATLMPNASDKILIGQAQGELDAKLAPPAAAQPATVGEAPTPPRAERRRAARAK